MAGVADQYLLALQTRKKMEELAEKMNTPEMQQQAASMQEALANPALQSRLKELQEDPEFEKMFADRALPT